MCRGGESVTPEVDGALKVLGSVLGVLSFVAMIWFFAYDRVVGRQKENARLEAAAVEAKNKATTELAALKQQFTEDIYSLRDKWRREDLEVISGIRSEMADLGRTINEARDKILVVETKVAPFWKIIEQAVLPRLNIPDDLNPINEEQRRGMATYVELRDKTPKKDLYLARDGFALEIQENPNLDPTTFLFYSLAYGSANARITDLEQGERNDG